MGKQQVVDFYIIPTVHVITITIITNIFT